MIEAVKAALFIPNSWIIQRSLLDQCQSAFETVDPQLGYVYNRVDVKRQLAVLR